MACVMYDANSRSFHCRLIPFQQARFAPAPQGGPQEWPRKMGRGRVGAERDIKNGAGIRLHELLGIVMEVSHYAPKIQGYCRNRRLLKAIYLVT